MTSDIITTLASMIKEFRALADKDSVSPDSLGELLSQMLDIISSVNIDALSAANAASTANSAAKTAYDRASAAMTKAEQALKNINTITSADVSDQIDSLQEVLTFLSGIKDDERLQAKLAELVTDVNALSNSLSLLSGEVNKKVTAKDGYGLSKNDFSDNYKSKLDSVQQGANKYVHPDKHPASVITEDATHRFMTDAERTKLQGVEANANNYVHPEKHPASVITEDATHRFMTDTERTKLQGVEANANKYVHPEKHPASVITEDDQKMFVSKEWKESVERVVKNGVELLPLTTPEYYTLPPAQQLPLPGVYLTKGDPYDYFTVNAYGSLYSDSDYNRQVEYMGAMVSQARTDRLFLCSGRIYTYDGTKLVAMATADDVSKGGTGGTVSMKAADITTDPSHRFITDAERKKWNTPQLLPIDGLCKDRASMPAYGIWAFMEANGTWTIDGDFSTSGLTRQDYCDKAGIDLSAYMPKANALYVCGCYEPGCDRIFYVDSKDGMALKPFAKLEDVPAAERMMPVLPVDAVSNGYEPSPLAETDDVTLAQIAFSGMLKWVVRGDVTKYGCTVEDYGTKNDTMGHIEPKAGLLLYDRGGKELYRTVEADESVAAGGVTVMRYACVDATLDRLPKTVTVKIESADYDSTSHRYSCKCASAFTEKMLKDVRTGDSLSFDDAALGDVLPKGVRGKMLVTNVWYEDSTLTVGFNVWGLDTYHVGTIWWDATNGYAVADMTLLIEL